MADQLATHKPFYYIWGGAPFLYPDLLELTAKIKKNRSPVAVVTNATFLEENARTVVDQGWDGLMFSVDGPEQLHDDIRSRKGTFRKMAAGVRAVRAYKRETGRSLPWLMPLMTVSTWNAGKLDEILNVASELGTDCAVVYCSWFTNEAIGRAHTKVFEKKLSVTPTAWQGYLFNHDVNTDALKASLRRIRQRRFPSPILYIPDLSDDQLATYYTNPAHFLSYGPCISLWTTAEIMPNGDVSPCRDYPDFITGNILERSLEDIWNGKDYVRFRKALIGNGGTFPICARCCGLMGW